MSNDFQTERKWSQQQARKVCKAVGTYHSQMKTKDARAKKVRTASK